MKFVFKISEKLTVELEATEQRPLFEQLADIQEVFGIDRCGKCKSEHIKFVVRTDQDDNKYYELRCNDCRARLAFGCTKKLNALFPKRKDADGKWLPNDGWTVYQKPTE
jgi:DNA-directed RNA polymerase subunit RPC12/RpoP